MTVKSKLGFIYKTHFKKTLFVFLFCFAFSFCCRAQWPHWEYKIHNGDCNYVIEIDSTFKDTSIKYTLSKFSIQGLSQRTTMKLRDKLSYKAGIILHFDSATLASDFAPICSIRRNRFSRKIHKLSRVRFLFDGPKNNALIRFEFE